MGGVCDAKNRIKKKISNHSEKLRDTSNNVKVSITKKKDEVVQHIKKIRKTGHKMAGHLKKEVEDTSFMKWAKKRPDMVFLLVITLIAALIGVLTVAWPYLPKWSKTFFTKEQYLSAMLNPTNSVSIKEAGEIALERQSLRDYLNFFKSRPYSLANTGLMDMIRGVIYLPIISFMLIFVFPPLTIAYIIWFIITYWRPVKAAGWGWFLMIYHYSKRVIECKLGEYWVISLLTGWHPCKPDFSKYFRIWRHRYIDRPIYYEKLRYIKAYHEAKKKYYTDPKKKYVDTPRAKYEIKLEFAKRLYLDRAAKVFMAGLIKTHDLLIGKPGKTWDQWLKKNNKHLASVHAKVTQTHAQLHGKPYRSVTPSGKVCTCPPSKTPLKLLKNAVKENIKNGHEGISHLVKRTNEIYDHLHKNTGKNLKDLKKDIPNCETVDRVVSHRNRIFLGIVLTLISVAVVLGGWSLVYGTPSWLYSIISPTSHIIQRGSSIISVMGPGNWTWLYLIILVLLMTGFGLYFLSKGGESGWEE